jgi:hypothetical protein
VVFEFGGVMTPFMADLQDGS